MKAALSEPATNTRLFVFKGLVTKKGYFLLCTVYTSKIVHVMYHDGPNCSLMQLMTILLLIELLLIFFFIAQLSFSL